MGKCEISNNLRNANFVIFGRGDKSQDISVLLANMMKC